MENKPTPEEILKEAIYNKIAEDLKGATLNSWKTDDGDGYPLLDHLSQGETIDSGISEIENIVDQIEIDELLNQYADLYHKEKLRGVFDKVLSFYIEDGNPECFRDKIINLRDEYLKTKE